MFIKAPTQLPKTFEEYDDARKAGFIKAKEFKEQGGRMVGYLCTYAPLEIVDAAGAVSVGLCGTTNETVGIAETVLPANLCPLIKSTYGFALSDKCPYTYFSDIIIGETTCDGKKKMYELLGDIKQVYVLRLPHDRTRAWARDAWYEEIVAFKEFLEEYYGTKITDEALREATKNRNKLRKALVELYNMQMMGKSAFESVELMSSLAAGKFSYDIPEYIRSIEAVIEQKKAEIDSSGELNAKKKRIVLTGCPSGGVINKIGKVIDENGGVIVCLDDCTGERTNSMMIDENAPDILRALSDKYIDINCSVMTPNDGRMQNTLDMVKKYNADGVIDFVLQCCHTFNVEAVLMQKAMEDAGVPYLKIETDYSASDSGQLETRIAAFIETI